MSEISLLPDQFREKEAEIRHETVRAEPAPGLSMHVPKVEDDDIEVIEVEEGEVDQLLVGEPFYSRLYYRMSLWVEEAKDKLFHARPVEPPPKLPPQFFKAPEPIVAKAQAGQAPVQTQPVGGPTAPQIEVAAKQPVATPAGGIEIKPLEAGAAMPKPKARIIPSAPSRGKRVRIIKRVRKPVQVSLLDEQFVSAMQVDVGKRKFTLAFLTIFFAAIFAGSYYLLDRVQTAAAQEQSQVDASYSTLKGQIAEAQKQWSSYQDLEPRLIAFNDLLDKHMALSRAFEFFERNTLSDVAYGNLTIDQNGKANLSVTAASYAAVARQLAVFKEAPELVTFNANAFSGDPQKGVTFQLAVQFKPQALIYAGQTAQAAGENAPTNTPAADSGTSQP